MANHIVGSFTIKITKHQQQYQIQALDPNNDIIVEPHPFIWDPNAKLKKILNLFQDPIKVQRVSLSQFTSLGQALYHAVFTPSIANALGRIRASVKEPNGIRIKLLVDPPELANLPWEIMHDNHDFIGLNSDYPLVRGFKDTSVINEVPVRGKLKILYAWANPEDQLDLELQESAEKIKTLLSKNKKIHFEILGHATRDKLQSKLLDEDYHIFCFAGHAGHGDNKGIFLENDNKASDKVSSLILARILQGKHVRLVFLAACDTAKTESSEDASFVESLIRDGNNVKAKLSSVVSMQYITTNVPDNPTTEPLTARFFEALASFRPVDIALSEARKSILDEHRPNVGVTRDEHRHNVSFTRDVFAPVLYLQSESSNLFRHARNWPAIIFATAFVIAALFGLLALSNAVNASEGETVARATAEAEATQRFYAQEREVEARGTAVAEATQRAYAQAEVTVQAELGATAVSAQIAEEQQKRIVLAHELAAESQIISTEFPQLGILLAIESIFATYSHKEAPTGDAEQALRDNLAKIGGIGLGIQEDHVSAVAFSLDGQLLATAIDDHTSSNEVSHKHTVRLWELGKSIVEPIILHNDDLDAHVDNMNFSSDNRWLVTTATGLCMEWDNSVLWDLTRLLTSKNAESHILTGCNATFSHNNRWLATATDTNVYIWDLLSIDSDPIIFTNHTNDVVNLAFSPNDEWLAIGEKGENAILQEVSNLPQLGSQLILTGHDIGVTNIDFSPNGKWLVTSSGAIIGEQANILLWNMGNLEARPITLPGPTDLSNWDIAISPDSNLLAISDINSISVWDISSEENLNTPPLILSGITTQVFSESGLPIRSGLSQIVFSHDNQWLAATSQDNTGVLWNISTPSSYDQPALLKGHELYVVDIAFSPDNRWIATASWDNTARLWDFTRLKTAHGQIAGTGYMTLSNERNSIKELAISPDGHWLVATGGTGGTSGNVNKIWDLQATDSPPSDLNIQDKSVVSLAFNPDGTWFATGTREGDIDFWDTSLQNWDSPIFTLSNDNEVLDIAFSPDKQWLATGGNDGRVDFWNLETLSKENVLTINGEKVTSLAFSPDGKWLAIGSDDDMGATSSKATIRILNLANQQIIHTLSDLGTYIEDMAFSPDGQWFAASTGFYHDWNGSVSLWKSSEIEESPQVLTGKSLAFSPDGQWLALEGGGTIYEREPTKLWNLYSDNNLVSDFISMTENSSFGHVIFSPDGNWLITGHFEEVRLWPLQMDILVDLACHTVGRNLTFLEWETYFPQENYRKTCSN